MATSAFAPYALLASPLPPTHHGVSSSLRGEVAVRRGSPLLGSPPPRANGFLGSLSPRARSFVGSASPLANGLLGTSAPSAKRALQQSGGDVDEHGRLESQALWLRNGCRSLSIEATEQVFQLADQEQDLAEHARHSGHHDEAAQELRWRLYGADVTRTEALRERSAIEHELQQLREGCQRMLLCEGQLQKRLSTLLDEQCEHSHASVDLQRRSSAARDKLQYLETHLGRRKEQLQSVQLDSAAAVGRLQRTLADGRARAERGVNESVQAMAGLWDAVRELAHLREEVTSVDGQLAAMRAQVRRDREEAAAHAQALQARVAGLASESACLALEACGHADARHALEAALTDAALCSRRLRQLQGTSDALQERLRDEHAAEKAEARAASQASFDLRVCEQRHSESTEAQRECRRRTELEAAAIRRGLTAQIGRARNAVISAHGRFGALRDQLVEFARLGDSVQTEQRDAEAAAERLTEEARETETRRHELVRQLQATQREFEVLRQLAKAVSAAGRARADASERTKRNLGMELERIVCAEAWQTDALAAEAQHRVAVERQLRQDLCDAEKAWDALRHRLETQNARLAQRVVHLENEGQDAEDELQAERHSVQALLSARKEGERRLASDHEAEEELNGTHEERMQESAKAMQREVAALQAERGRLSQAVRSAETLNASLSAGCSRLQGLQEALPHAWP